MGLIRHSVITAISHLVVGPGLASKTWSSLTLNVLGSTASQNRNQ